MCLGLRVMALATHLQKLMVCPLLVGQAAALCICALQVCVF